MNGGGHGELEISVRRTRVWIGIRLFAFYSTQLTRFILDFSYLIKTVLPETVRMVSVFEDFDDNIASILGDDAMWPLDLGDETIWAPLGGAPVWLLKVEVPRPVAPSIGAALAPTSLNFEHLSVSYMVNAEDFFQACRPTWNWKDLKSLSLTSQLLSDSSKRQKVYALLHEAGTVALQMPKLHTLQIWYGTRASACAFIYYRQGQYACITWRGTWDLELGPRLITLWEGVAFNTGARGLRVEKEQLHGLVKSHGDAIHHLRLPYSVVSPTSLRQIRREGNRTLSI